MTLLLSIVAVILIGVVIGVVIYLFTGKKGPTLPQKPAGPIVPPPPSSPSPPIA